MEKLIELINQVQDCGCDITGVVEMNYIENDTLADHLVAHGVTVHEWISVKDRLPKRHGRYLVFVKNLTRWHVLDNPVFVADFVYGQWNFHGWEDNCVTHWMPLPQPPKGE